MAEIQIQVSLKCCFRISLLFMTNFLSGPWIQLRVSLTAIILGIELWSLRCNVGFILQRVTVWQSVAFIRALVSAEISLVRSSLFEKSERLYEIMKLLLQSSIGIVSIPTTLKNESKFVWFKNNFEIVRFS